MNGLELLGLYDRMLIGYRWVSVSYFHYRFFLHCTKLNYRIFLSVGPFSGQTSRTVSSSPSVESLSGGKDQAMSSPPLPTAKGWESSTSSPPLSATKKDLFFNISRSRSHSKSIGKKDLVSHRVTVNLSAIQSSSLCSFRPPHIHNQMDKQCTPVFTNVLPVTGYVWIQY